MMSVETLSLRVKHWVEEQRSEFNSREACLVGTFSRRAVSWKIYQLDIKPSRRTGHYEIAFHCQSRQTKFIVEKCNLAESLRDLAQILDGVKIDVLNISNNPDLGTEVWYQLGVLVRQSGVKTLLAADCHLTAECLKSLEQGLDGAKIDWLDINSNPDLGTEGWCQLGVLVRQSEVKSLWAGNCHLTAECLESFTQGLDGYKLEQIYCCSSVAREMILTVCREVHVWHCDFCENVKSKHQKLNDKMRREIDSMQQQLELKKQLTAAEVCEMYKCAYHLSFDRRLQRPLCVLECLQMGYLKDTENKKYKRPSYSNENDEAGNRVVRGDFIQLFEGGSYTRGHMAAAANHKYSKSTYNATFTYMNMLPLKPNLDGLTSIENMIRNLVWVFDFVVIVTSAIYDNCKNIPESAVKIVKCVAKSGEIIWWFFCVPNVAKENGPLSKYLSPHEIIEKLPLSMTMPKNLVSYYLDEKYRNSKCFKKDAVKIIAKKLQEMGGSEVNYVALFR